jgi:hypothetical protein
MDGPEIGGSGTLSPTSPRIAHARGLRNRRTAGPPEGSCGACGLRYHSGFA